MLSRLQISPNNDDEHYEALVERQTKKDKDLDTPRYYDFIPIGSTVTFQQEDGGLWIHGTIAGKGDHNPNNISYTICMTKTGLLIIRKTKYVKTTQTTAK